MRLAASSMQLVIQPKFADQIQNLTAPLGVQAGGAEGFQRGYMIWADKGGNLGYAGGPLGDGRDMIRFLFNPSTVSSDYNIGNASLQAAMMYQVPGDNGNLLSPLTMQTVSWQLYFDRMYELNYNGNSSAINDPAVIGVQADIYQFMQFTGVLAQLNRAQANSVFGGSGSSTSGGVQSSTTGGIMMMIPCYVYFGNALAQMNTNVNSSNFNALASQLAYYGFISEWSVNYTHWTSSMVPIRAAVSVNFTMLPTPPTATAQAVWKDLQTLGSAPYTVPIPYAPGYTPPTSGNGGVISVVSGGGS